jgi:hypothetical protein
MAVAVRVADSGPCFLKLVDDMGTDNSAGCFPHILPAIVSFFPRETKETG